jgi:cytochrome P450
MSTQLDEDGEGGHPPMETPTLAVESALVIVAGSDTTSAALSNALFYLLHTPGAYAKLRAELDVAAAGASLDIELDAATLVELPFLDAVM